MVVDKRGRKGEVRVFVEDSIRSSRQYRMTTTRRKAKDVAYEKFVKTTEVKNGKRRRGGFICSSRIKVVKNGVHGFEFLIN
jgi:hypothetical protein